MATTDDTSTELPSNSEQLLKQLMEAQRAKLLQAHAIMVCLREVLLYADDDHAVIYAEAANAAALLANSIAEEFDSVRLQSMFNALRLELGLSPGADDDSSVMQPPSLP